MFYRKTMIVFMLAVLCASPRAMADMDASEKDVSVRKLGVAWNIAEDRKMENSGGVYQPEGLDKYMKRYFDQLSAKIDLLTQKMSQLSEQGGRLEKKTDDLLSRNSRALSSSAQKN